MKKEIDDIFRKYRPGRREELIPLLQELQEMNGFLSEEAVIRVGGFTGLSTTKIYGLATFYDQFRFYPSGKILIKVCNGTSCFLNGSQSLLNKMKEETGLDAGQTNREGTLTYEVVTCMGGCNNGPVMMIDGEYHTSVKSEHLPEMIRKLRYIIEND
jgi:NADH-quinone oxidoreductase subunit E